MILDVILKSTLVLISAAVIVAALRDRVAASVRHAIWVIALAGALLVPVLTVALPSLHVPLFSRDEAPRGCKGRAPVPALRRRGGGLS